MNLRADPRLAVPQFRFATPRVLTLVLTVSFSYMQLENASQMCRFLNNLRHGVRWASL